jgi:hypothetical protein
MADGSDVINDHQAAKILAARQAELGQMQAGASDVKLAIRPVPRHSVEG